MRETSGSTKTLLSSSDADVEEGDLPPMTAEELERAPLVPRVKTLRRALAMTQEAFGAAYGIPLGTLRDWEQGATQPDMPARSYLRAIAGDPEAVRRALRATPPPPGAVLQKP